MCDDEPLPIIKSAPRFSLERSDSIDEAEGYIVPGTGVNIREFVTLDSSPINNPVDLKRIVSSNETFDTFWNMQNDRIQELMDKMKHKYPEPQISNVLNDHL